MAQTDAEKKEQALTEYRSKLQKHKEIDTKVRALRETVKELKKDYDKTEDDLKALQVGCLFLLVVRRLVLLWCVFCGASWAATAQHAVCCGPVDKTVGAGACLFLLVMRQLVLLWCVHACLAAGEGA